MAERSDAMRSRRRILDAAVAELARDPTATVDRIADEAGVGRATVHRHFPTRQHLLRAVFVEVIDRLDEAVADAWLDADDARVTLRRAIDRVLAAPGDFRILVMVSGLELDDEMRERFDRILARIRTVFERAAAVGAVRDGLAVGWLAEAWSAIVVVALEYVIDGRLEPADVGDLVDTTFFDGVARPRRRRTPRA